MFCGECLERVDAWECVLVVRQDAGGRVRSATFVCLGCLKHEGRPRNFKTVGRDALRELVIEALTEARGNVGQAAGLLELSRHTMYRRMHEYGLNWRDFRVQKLASL